MFSVLLTTDTRGYIDPQGLRYGISSANFPELCNNKNSSQVLNSPSVMVTIQHIHRGYEINHKKFYKIDININWKTKIGKFLKNIIV